MAPMGYFHVKEESQEVIPLFLWNAIPLSVLVLSVIWGFQKLLSGDEAFLIAILCGICLGFNPLIKIGGVFSRADKYQLFRVPFTRRMRYEDYKVGSLKSVLIANMNLGIRIMFLMPCGFFIIYLLVFRFLAVDSLVAVIVLFLSLVFMLACRERTDRALLSFRTITIIHSIVKCLACHNVTLSAANKEILTGVYYNAARTWGDGVFSEETLTMDMVHRLIKSVSHSDVCLEADKRMLDFIMSCENAQGGFSVWPAAHPRLSSTYYALQSLLCLDLGEVTNGALHINWILNCQEETGIFKSPLSNRSDWENIYFALSSLDTLNGLDQLLYKGKTISWLQHELYESVLKTDIHKVYCCGMSLNLLKSLHQGTQSVLSEFILKIVLRLRHSKIRYMAKSLSELFELGKLIMTEKELKELFPDIGKRLTAALEAELKPFVKYRIQLQEQTATT